MKTRVKAVSSSRLASLLPFLFLIACGMSTIACSTIKPTQTGRRGFFSHLEDPRPTFSIAEERNRERATRSRSTSALPVSEVRSMDFVWPVKDVQVTSSFGRRGTEYHEGVDLRASSGTPVHAAQSGVVLYSGSKIRGYGKLVVIRHQKGISTIYAHNSRLMVVAGSKVERGQLIALSGNTGHSTGPHLHFEIRDGEEARNPLDLMPDPSMAPQPVLAQNTKAAPATRAPAAKTFRKVTAAQKRQMFSKKHRARYAAGRPLKRVTVARAKVRHHRHGKNKIKSRTVASAK
jgi:hypothetical protein